MHTYVIKVVIIGEAGVGKSSLAMRAENPKALVDKHHNPTIGVDLTTTLVTIANPVVGESAGTVGVKLRMWDTAGQEKYSIITRTYYSDARMAWMVYDCSRVSTLRALLDRWLPELVAHSKHLEHMCVVVVGNKADLAQGSRHASDTRLLLELLEQIQTHTGRPAQHIRVSALKDTSMLPLVEMATRECLTDPDTRKAATPAYVTQRSPTYIDTSSRAPCCTIS